VSIAYWQYQLPLWVVFFLFLAVLLIPMEIGFRLGKRRKQFHLNPEGEVRSDMTLAAMLALLGLMLAFTYSFSMSRADLRKQSLITEVNALGTAFLRADLLPEPGRTYANGSTNTRNRVMWNRARSRPWKKCNRSSSIRNNSSRESGPPSKPLSGRKER